MSIIVDNIQSLKKKTILRVFRKVFLRSKIICISFKNEINLLGYIAKKLQAR